jgi:hypothetical protein
MKSYRVFPMDGNGHVGGSPDHVEAETDDEAIALVERSNTRDGRPVEIWDGNRLVVRLPAPAPR